MSEPILLPEDDDLLPKNPALMARPGMLAPQVSGPQPIIPTQDVKAADAPVQAAKAGPVPIGGGGPTPISDPRLAADQSRLDVLRRSGSGIDQLTHPVDANGNPTGAHVGIGHKIGAVLARIGDVAGSAFFPGIAEAIPGTTMHHNALIGQAQGNINNDLAGAKQQAETANLQAQPELKQAQLDLKQTTEDARETHQQDQIKAALAKINMKTDDKGNVIPMEYSEMSLPQQAAHDLKDSQTELVDAQKAYKEAQTKNMPVAMQQAQQRIATAQANAHTAMAKLGLQQQEFERDTYGTVGGEAVPGLTDANGKPQGLRVASLNQKVNAGTRQDVREHDKAYVQPAEAVEKSYQMMNNAYNEYLAAKKAGTELPTGAQSMVALSTHLSTTFGNVKGARITKDMIEHHLGARGVSDGAQVAVQRLTNGDVLSPAQWDAFHDLIKQSRNLSWQTATKQANRKNIPVDFLPPDLQGQAAPVAPQGGTAAEEYVRDPKTNKLVLKPKGAQ